MCTKDITARFGVSVSHLMANFMRPEAKMERSSCGRTATDHMACGVRIENNTRIRSSYLIQRQSCQACVKALESEIRIENGEAF